MDIKNIKSQISYDSENGTFEWITRRSGRRSKQAGNISQQGYLMICIDGKQYCAHRLGWMLHYGEMPSGDLDHIDGDRLNNRIANLRVAVGSQNNCNTRLYSNNKSGIKGVSWHKRSQKWRAVIYVNRKAISLGEFSEIDAAAEAYAKAAVVYHGEFANPATSSDSRKKYPLGR